MFEKKDADNAQSDQKPSSNPTSNNVNKDGASSQPLKPFSHSAPVQPRSAFHPDVPSHKVVAAIPNTPTRDNFTGIPGASYISGANGGQASADATKQLIIGGDVCLKGGEILACDQLILIGTLEETSLIDASHMEITSVGRFKGTAIVENAIIAGTFEGDLTVRQRLTLSETGKITGSVRYGSIVIEPGGTISGDMKSLADT